MFELGRHWNMSCALWFLGMLDPVPGARYRDAMNEGSSKNNRKHVTQWLFLAIAALVLIGYGVMLLGQHIQANSPEELALNNLETTRKFERLDRAWRTEWNLQSLERAPWKAHSAKEDASQVDPKRGLVLVNVWATWCEPCKAEFPSMVELARDQPNITLVFVSYDETWTVQKQFFDQLFGGVPRGVVLLRDPAGKGQGDQPADTLWQKLGATAVPETFIVRNGHMISKVVGGLNWKHPEVRAYLATVMQRRPMTGCEMSPTTTTTPVTLLLLSLLLLCIARWRFAGSCQE